MDQQPWQSYTRSYSTPSRIEFETFSEDVRKRSFSVSSSSTAFSTASYDSERKKTRNRTHLDIVDPFVDIISASLDLDEVEQDRRHMITRRQPRYSENENLAVVHACLHNEWSFLTYGTREDNVECLYQSYLRMIAPEEANEYPSRPKAAILRHYKHLKSKTRNVIELLQNANTPLAVMFRKTQDVTKMVC
mmetsp:Transcript_8322/g.10003  ORF Transcript_8322/g.10003 Transcript_8322/m.10003 type:complete len:191 (+) Transcript_8322:19-591(+)|eukprot:CAMPEP_0184011888 /NCGR_PEP_ID=MMETSP0954-20121128/4076_1 /TAXON_ID=627963 /ORGANISM="Aplanochytrium sp, Strain PBS07" /LENGTH=190 /DNA_ID=CAMNT_0026291753 /DNA_START=112 /DNA_END=684 /DNA_ORIENTATION=-